MSNTIEETSNTSRVSDAWNNASLVLNEGQTLISIITAISTLTAAIMLGGALILFMALIIALGVLIVFGTYLRMKGFFFRIFNSYFASQVRPLWVNQSDYLAVRIALFLRQTDTELHEKAQALEERLGIERIEPIHSNGVKEDEN